MSILSGVNVFGRVGPAANGDGTQPQIRTGRESETITAGLRGTHAEATSRGQVFSISNGATGIAPGTALTTTVPLCIYNPVGSGLSIEIIKVAMGYISGTLGAGSVFHCSVAGQGSSGPTSGTGLTPKAMCIGKTATSGATCNTGGTVAATPVALYPFGSFGAELASTATGEQQVIDNVDGAITVEEGGVYCPEAIAAGGSTPLVSFGIVWRERTKTGG